MKRPEDEVLDWKESDATARDVLIELRSSSNRATEEEISKATRLLENLEQHVRLLEAEPQRIRLNAAEMERRRDLVTILRRQLKHLTSDESDSVGVSIRPAEERGGGRSPGTSRESSAGTRRLNQEKIVPEQDEILQDIEEGLERLQTRNLALKAETDLQNEILDELDGKVEQATAAINCEAEHAERLMKKSGACRMYMCIGVLFIFLGVLLVVGFGPSA